MFGCVYVVCMSVCVCVCVCVFVCAYVCVCVCVCAFLSTSTGWTSTASIWGSVGRWVLRLQCLSDVPVVS